MLPEPKKIVKSGAISQPSVPEEGSIVSHPRKTNEVVYELNLKPVKSKQERRAATGASILTIVNTRSHGKRITIAEDVIKEIGSPEAIMFLVNEEGVALRESLAENKNSFFLCKLGKKNVVYCTDLIVEISAIFNLDFTSRTSISFHDVSYLRNGDGLVAFVPLRPNLATAIKSVQQDFAIEEDVEPASLDSSDLSNKISL